MARYPIVLFEEFIARLKFHGYYNPTMLTPVRELAPHIETGNPIAWRFVSQPGDETMLGLHVDRAIRVTRVAGLGGLLIRNGPETQTPHMANSSLLLADREMDDITSTSAGPMERASLRDWQEGKDEVPDSTYYHWPFADIDIIGEAIEAQVQKRMRAGFYRSEALALELDRSLRRGIGRAALSKFKEDISWFKAEPYKTLTFGAFEIVFWSGIYDSAKMGCAVALAVTAGKEVLVDYMTRHRIRKGNEDPSHLMRRWSLFPGEVQPDRLAAAAMLLSSRRLIRPL